MKTRFALMVLAISALAAVAQADQMVYDANDEFSLVANPNGVWSYGHTDFAGVYPALPDYMMNTPSNWLTRPDGLVNIDSWGTSGGYDPSVTHNGSGAPITKWGFTWGVNDIGLDSYGATTGEASIIQWKAPRAGTVVADAMFRASTATIYEGFNGTVVKVALNDAAVGTTWSDTFTVNAGDCIAFAGQGPTVTMFQGSVTYVPEPGTVTLLAMGAFGLLCYAWRKQK